MGTRKDQGSRLVCQGESGAFFSSLPQISLAATRYSRENSLARVFPGHALSQRIAGQIALKRTIALHASKTRNETPASSRTLCAVRSDFQALPCKPALLPAARALSGSASGSPQCPARRGALTCVVEEDGRRVTLHIKRMKFKKFAVGGRIFCILLALGKGPSRRGSASAGVDRYGESGMEQGDSTAGKAR